MSENVLVNEILMELKKPQNVDLHTLELQRQIQNYFQEQILSNSNINIKAKKIENRMEKGCCIIL